MRMTNGKWKMTYETKMDIKIKMDNDNFMNMEAIHKKILIRN